MNDPIITIEIVQKIAAFFFAASCVWAFLSIIFPSYGD